MDQFLDEVEELVLVFWEDVGWDRLNCQLYSGWRLGKFKPGIVSDREGQVEAAGESIEVGGVGLCGGGGVSNPERDPTSVVDFGYETFGADAVGVGHGGGSDVGKSSGYGLC